MAQNVKKPVQFWLRAESKPLERRTLLLPKHCKILLEAGHKVTVENSKQRIVPISAYSEIEGLQVAEEFSWQTKVGKEHVILGLKELPESESPLISDHVYFAHCYKNQVGWQSVLRRFLSGGSRLWDLEFLNDSHGRRVAAFGRSAGIAGMGLGLMAWCSLKSGTAIPDFSDPFPDIESLAQKAKSMIENLGTTPRVIIIGALGRCGTGAVDLARLAGIPDSHLSRWDLAETSKGGPFPEILEHDIFVNCIYLDAKTKINPFITKELIGRADLKLSLMVDVSCDSSNPNNPVPIYEGNSTFPHPTIDVPTLSGRTLHVIAIDHLPSLIPEYSSKEFADAIVGHLVDFPNTDVWRGANKIFEEKIALLKSTE